MGNLFDYINWIAVGAAALAYFFLGALWYSKLLFAPKWIAYLKIDVNDPNAKKGMGMMFGGSLVMMFVSAVAIAILSNRLGLEGWKSGIKIGAFVSIFNLSSMAINYLYEKKPLGLFLINGIYQLVGNVIGGVIICCWH